MKTIRWVLLLPAAIIVSLLVESLVKLIYIGSQSELWTEIVMSIAGPVGFIYMAMYVAPGKKKIVLRVTALLYLIFSIGLLAGLLIYDQSRPDWYNVLIGLPKIACTLIIYFFELKQLPSETDYDLS